MERIGTTLIRALISGQNFRLEGYILNFTCVRYYYLYVEFSDFYVKQSLPGETLQYYY
jgi:hypothetical protein